MIIIAPAKSEKAIQRIGDENSIVFRVHIDADKKTIREEFEKLFSVKVRSIRTFTTPKGHKHAIIRLKKEFSADEISAKMKMIA